jgi:hypothetical protein
MSPLRIADELCRRAVLIMPFVVLLGLGVRSEPRPGLREDEVQCEEAKARLLECCPLFTSNLECTYLDNDNCNPPTLPDLESGQATSVQHMSCAEIEKSDLCGHQYDHSTPESGY